MHLLFKDLKTLCIYYIKKQEARELLIEDQDESSTGDQNANNLYSDFKSFEVMNSQSSALAAAASYNNIDEPLSMIEKTAKRILPIIAKV